jgi:hypothetical protein
MAEQANPGARQGQRQQLLERLLTLVERSLNDTTQVPDAEWQALRTMAEGQPRSLELIARLQKIVADCTAEIEKRRVAGDDVGPLRSAIVEHIRATVVGATPSPSSPAANTSGGKA